MLIPQELWLPLFVEPREPESWGVLYADRARLGRLFARACAPLTARMFLAERTPHEFEQLWQVFGLAWAYTGLYVMEFGEYGMPWAAEKRLMARRECMVYAVAGVLQEANAVVAGCGGAVLRQTVCTGGRQHRAGLTALREVFRAAHDGGSAGGPAQQPRRRPR